MNAFNVRENINPNVEFDEVFNEMIDCLSSYSTPTAMMDEAVRMHYEAEDNLTQNDFEKQQQAMIDRAEKREEDRIQDELNKQEALSEEDYERMRQGFDEQRTRPKQSDTVSNGNKRKPDSRTTDGGQSTDDGRRSEETSQRAGSADAERNNEEIKSKIDNQGNPIDEEGKLITEKVNSIDDITDGDFTNPTRSIELPTLPQKVQNAIGTDGKPVIIKKNIFEKNKESHKDVTPADSREILQSALYDTKLYGQNQKATKPYNWVVINTKDENGLNRIVLLEVKDSKNNIEIVHWHYIDERGLEKIKRQADREGGQLLILPSEEEAGALSSRTDDLSSAGKDNIKYHFGKKNKLKINKKDENKIGVALYVVNKEAKRCRDLSRWMYKDREPYPGAIEILQQLGDIGEEIEIDEYGQPFLEDEYSKRFYSEEGLRETIMELQNEIDEAEAKLEEEEDLSDIEKEEFEETIDFNQDYIDTYSKYEDDLGKVSDVFYLIKQMKIRKIDLYNLKEQIIENLEDSYIIGRHKFPNGDVRYLYKIGDFIFHGEDIQDELSDEEYDKIEEIDEISAENKLEDEKKISIGEAEKILNDFIAKNITESESKRKGMLGVVLDALRKAIGKENVITDNRQAQRVIDEVNGRVRPEMTEDVFYSNAERSVENISQDKATPEQWLKMIEKQGGLKAGEDKWLGLSDWLKDSKEKTLTKQDVLDFIRSNKIQIEEVEYGDAFFSPNSKINFENDIARARENGESYESVIEAWDEKYDTMLRYAYRHGFFTVDENGKVITNTPILQPINGTRRNFTTAFLKNKKEIAIVVPNIESWNEWDEIHFGDAGNGRAVAWIRFGETTDKDGDRVLVIDEIQSKRHQEGREKGYKSKRNEELRKKYSEANDNLFAYEEALSEKYADTSEWWKIATPEELQERQRLTDARDKAMEAYAEVSYKEGSIPDAPFEKNWHELAMKRMLRYAAENGYDKVAWTTGEQQAERYNIGNVVESIIYYDYPARKDKEGRNTKKIVIRSHNNEPMSMRVNNEGLIIDAGSELRGKNLMEVLGKELAAKILNGDGSDITLWDESMDNPAKEINGNGLRIGGEGMKGFYDQMLPRFMDKYGKKWGVKTQDVELPDVEEAGRIMHSVDVTDEMRRSVMEGQPLFQRVSSEEVNKRFNEELDEFKDKQLKGGILHLGEPNGLLIACGLNASEITLTAKTLKEHLDKHGISIEEIKDLPNAINNPMMVYEWGTKAKSTIIITNITRESGDKITVAVKLERNGEEMTINEIASIHGKEGQRFISDMINAKEGGIEKALKYIQKDRKEVLDWLGLDAPKASASLTNEELHIAKVLQNFENPAIIEQKNEKNLKEHRLVGGNSGYVGYSMSKRAEQAREEGRYPKTDFKKVYNISDKTLKALVSAGIIDDNEWHHASTPIHEYTHLWAEPWGQRTCYVADPDGNLIEISSFTETNG